MDARPQPQGKVARLKRICELTGLGRSSIYNRMNSRSPHYDPTFPRSFLPGATANSAVGWNEEEIQAWVAAGSGVYELIDRICGIVQRQRVDADILSWVSRHLREVDQLRGVGLLSVDQLKRIREALSPYGLKLLKSDWRGWNAQYRFRCSNGREISRSGAHLYYNLIACPTCRDEESLRQLDQLARQAGGRCLSAKYAGRPARYQFVCREGHTFEKTASNLQKGSWCVLCARAEHSKRMSDPDGMKRLRAVARNRGGKCLSATYTKLSDRYRFRCAEGHEWETVGYEVTRGAWCRKCANARKSVAYRRADGLQAMQAHA
ncbi:helix-turn-helix transcriptional regulator [Burkholderia cepacia]|uniref:helix-turn-helix transcriptional regulator n=1 Tax=Burkholderia cepacia TaxID=292 RepID=UPI001CF56E90|nr:AlpA family phage regulatory protein [Burkholderia cepacia]MCA8355095.1 AlpA family phage regulatory protein [Burkholderia cepacia]